MIGGVQTGGSHQATTQSGAADESPLPLLGTDTPDASGELPPPPVLTEVPIEFGARAAFYEQGLEEAENWLRALQTRLEEEQGDLEEFTDLLGALDEMVAEDPNDIEAVQYRDALRTIADGLRSQIAQTESAIGEAEEMVEEMEEGDAQFAIYGDNEDFDGDGLINAYDTDKDNDGILDATENNGRADLGWVAQPIDINGDGNIDQNEINAAQFTQQNAKWLIDADFDGITDAGEWYLGMNYDVQGAAGAPLLNPYSSDNDHNNILDRNQLPDTVARTGEAAGYNVFVDRTVGPADPATVGAQSVGNSATWPEDSDDPNKIEIDLADLPALMAGEGLGGASPDADIVFRLNPTDDPDTPGHKVKHRITFMPDPNADNQVIIQIEIDLNGDGDFDDMDAPDDRDYRFTIHSALDEAGNIRRRIFFENTGFAPGDVEVVFQDISATHFRDVADDNGVATAGIHFDVPPDEDNISFVYQPFHGDTDALIVTDDEGEPWQGTVNIPDEGSIAVRRYDLTDAVTEGNPITFFFPDEIDGVEVKRVQFLAGGSYPVDTDGDPATPEVMVEHVLIVFRGADGQILGEGTLVPRSAVEGNYVGADADEVALDSYNTQIIFKLANNGQYVDAADYMANIIGGRGNDYILVRGGEVDGRGGWDYINGGVGELVAWGGDGNDIIVANGGIEAYGGDGNDIIHANITDNPDTPEDETAGSNIHGGAGHDWLLTGQNDGITVYGDEGYDLSDAASDGGVHDDVEIGVFDAESPLGALVGLSNQNDQMAAYMRDFLEGVGEPMEGEAQRVAAEAITEGAMSFIMQQEAEMLRWYGMGNSPFESPDDEDDDPPGGGGGGAGGA